MTYERKLAEAVRDECLQEFFKAGYKPVHKDSINIDAIIASVPRPEPACKVEQSPSGKVYVNWSGVSNILAYVGIELFAAPVSAEPVNARLWKAAQEMVHAAKHYVVHSAAYAKARNDLDHAVVMAAAEQAKV